VLAAAAAAVLAVLAVLAVAAAVVAAGVAVVAAAVVAAGVVVAVAVGCLNCRASLRIARKGGVGIRWSVSVWTMAAGLAVRP
jgi:hypothetical protein